MALSTVTRLNCSADEVRVRAALRSN